MLRSAGNLDSWASVSSGVTVDLFGVASLGDGIDVAVGASPVAVPEPASLLLLASGLVSLGVLVRKRCR